MWPGLIFILCFIHFVPPEIMQNISVFLLFYCKPLLLHGLEGKKNKNKHHKHQSGNDTEIKKSLCVYLLTV